MSESNGKRLQEGALSALKTPKNPPAPTKLVPLRPTASEKPKGKWRSGDQARRHRLRVAPRAKRAPPWLRRARPRSLRRLQTSFPWRRRRRHL